ncbi:hypothetical protein SSIG_07227 [Streptomyces filamentosus NRRL 11379]|uniref:Predicted protein n=1 Tax=Streptomyces filamentosus NRRL 15998 TaxID=457431 RepID=D6AM16_STRFL|nr:predicted protein [Streptomyces filamentosus NRRL 15998]EWS92436.1 hypothetical protein SSIG_07227 [Streptomyces filamentosus NRRL 11379]
MSRGHRQYADRAAPGRPPHHRARPGPGLAPRIRATTDAGLDHDARRRARAWLGDRRSAEAAIRSLRRGQGYAYELPTTNGTWRWTAYPVSALPLLPINQPPRSHA